MTFTSSTLVSPRIGLRLRAHAAPGLSIRTRIRALLLLLLAAVLSFTTHPAKASAAPVPTVENSVGVTAPATISAVGVAEHIRAGQHPARAGPRPGLAQAHCVAAETDSGLVNLASEGRTSHILQGDATGGGHLWPGAAGKTSFPQS